MLVLYDGKLVGTVSRNDKRKMRRWRYIAWYLGPMTQAEGMGTWSLIVL